MPILSYEILSYLGFLGTVIAAVWSLAWWLSSRFDSIRRDVILLGKEITDKLEYHERHDDKRFSQMRDDIWDIRVRNAAIDKIIPIKHKELN